VAVGILYEFPSIGAVPKLHPVWSDSG